MNVHPFRRRRTPAGDSPVESALRRSLARHAFDTPDADDLTRRILAVAEDEPDALRTIETPVVGGRATRGPWLTWGLPLVAAASVAAVVGVGAVIASSHVGDHSQQAATGAPRSTEATPTPTPTTSSARPTSPRATAAEGTSGLTNVKILDLTFFRQDEGVALASADCIGKPGRCTALLQTSDGKTWTSKGGGINFDVPTAKGCPVHTCVDHIRFANAAVGYAFGPGAFYLTTDAGARWTKEPGGAAALETLDNNVIRVRTGSSSECLPGCPYVVQTADVGSPDWTTVPLPGRTPHGDGVQLSRGGSHAYLLVTQNPAGGSDERSTLYRSGDDGASWQNGSEPCPQGAGEDDSYQVAAGNDADVTVLCRTRAGGPYRVAESTDGGETFALRGGSIAYADVAPTNSTQSVGALPSVLAGDPPTVLAVAGRGVSISRDGGTTWHQAPDLVGTFSSVGFENPRVGRAFGDYGSQIWTTRNAGRTWHESIP